ncbi:MAG: class I SAM-dependent methyltransferase [Candidatus Poseidoniaceae archaeon]|nr:class I SAM-dependent methyltransferase [Candidatus Poseidoniaceae archaeon]
MIEVDCYNCKSSNHEFYDSENGHTIVKCIQCGLLFLNPRPGDEEISRVSKSRVYKADELPKVTGTFKEYLKEIYLSRLNDFNYAIMFNQKKRFTWLDINCGHGEFVETVSTLGDKQIDIIGLEPNVRKLEQARERGMDVRFFDLSTHQEKYDVISALNVYSHLPNPPEDIARWCEMLNEGGELLLQTGDTAELAAEHHHKPYSLPDHLSFTSKKLLIELLQKLGMKVIQVEKYRLSQYPIFSYLGLLKEIARFFLPGHVATFKFSPEHPDTDMWIRAKKISNNNSIIE